MSKKLYDSLLEYLIVIGCDQDTGLTLTENQLTEQDDISKIANIPIDPSILAVISYDLANYPASSHKINLNYPPIKLIKDVSFDLGNIDPNSKRFANRRTTVKSIESPIQADILQNLPQFCFPNQVYISKSSLEPSIHSFVLTDIEGKKTYAMTLVYSIEYYCSKNEQNDKIELINVYSDSDETEEKRNYFQIYIPTAIVLVSKFSYLNVLKECISCIYDSVLNEPKNFRSIIENFTFYLTHLPVSPISFERFSLVLEFSISTNKDIFIYPLDEYGFEVFDLNLSLIFTKFSIDNILYVVLAILTESKLLFITKSYGLLTPVIQSFLKLIQPFKWLLPYVPLLPSSQLEYIEAPHPFIMGYNAEYSSLMNRLNQVIKKEDIGLIIIDIDNNRIHWPTDLKLVNFPITQLNELKKKLIEIDFNFVQTKKLLCPSKMDWYSNEIFEKTLNNQLNSQITDLFLEFFVEIFGDLNKFVKNQTKTFNKKNYLDSFAEKDLPFYEQIVETSIFEIFLSGFIKNTTEGTKNLYHDKFRQVAFKLGLNGVDLDESFNQTRNRSGSSLNMLNFKKPIIKTLKIPTFSLKIAEFFTKEIEIANLLSYKDCLFYLRGLYYLSISQIKEGFKDLYSIESKHLFPKTLIKNEIWPSLNQTQKDFIKNQDFYKSAADFKNIDENASHFTHQIQPFNSIDLILNEYDCLLDLTFGDFTSKLDQLDIRIDLDTAERLFKSLTLEKQPTLEFSTFEAFIDNYQLKEEELQKINKYLPINKVRSIEFALKVSNHTVVPEFGIGRVVLTQRCLYFLEQGTNKRKLLTELPNILLIEKTQYTKGFFKSKSALKITSINQIIYLCAEGETNIWFLLINELCSSLRIANETKDSTLIQYAAKNVLLLDAVLLSGLDTSTTHSKDLDKSIKYLCYFTLLKSDSTRKLINADANKVLNLRINPSCREFNNQSVESIIYVDIENYPTVWCAIGNKVKIYDAITWSDEGNDINLNAKITCLLDEPTNSKIWISTLDKCLYVMDVHSRSFNKRIQDHTDVIISIVFFSKLKWILSASSNGEILIWDPDKLEKIDVIKTTEVYNQKKLVDILSSKEYLLIVLTDQIKVLDEKLELKETFNFKIGDNFDQISCSCISFDKQENEEFLWVGNSRNGIVFIWSLKTFELKMRIGVDDCQGFRSFLCVDDLIWSGSKDGKLILFCSKNFEFLKSFKAHNDTVRSLCYVENNKFVVSGSGSKDGTVAVWRVSSLTRKTIMSSMKRMLAIEDN